MIRAVLCAVAILSVIWFRPAQADACGVKLAVGAPKARRIVAARQPLSPKRTSDDRRPVRTGPTLRLREAAGGSENVATAPVEQPPVEQPPEPKKAKKRAPKPPPVEDTATDEGTTTPEPAVADTGTTKTPDPDDSAPSGKGKARVASRGYFANASSALSANYKARLDQTARWLEQNPDKKITVEGHTSSVGNPDLNQALSERRAEVVKEYLVSQGVDESRITARGVGSDKPAFEPGRNGKNRRVEITVD